MRKPAKPATPDLTPRTLELFLAYARDAGNWSGTPLVGGNVGGSKEDRGNITQMKRAGLVQTFVSDGHTWLEFTAAGVIFAARNGVHIDELNCKPDLQAAVIQTAGLEAPEDWKARDALADTVIRSHMPGAPALPIGPDLPADQRALAARLLGQAEPVADPTIEVALDADTRRKLDDLAE